MTPALCTISTLFADARLLLAGVCRRQDAFPVSKLTRGGAWAKIDTPGWPCTAGQSAASGKQRVPSHALAACCCSSQRDARIVHFLVRVGTAQGRPQRERRGWQVDKACV